MAESVQKVGEALCRRCRRELVVTQGLGRKCRQAFYRIRAKVKREQGRSISVLEFLEKCPVGPVSERFGQSVASDRIPSVKEKGHLLRTAYELTNGFLIFGAKMDKVAHLVARVAPTDVGVLVTGESGVGKEFIARAIHEKSARRNGEFVVVHCGALVASLAESELFGHVSGAFTDARFAKEGLFAHAHGGTVFLDEVSSLPLVIQPKLLRVLESGEYRRVGDSQARKSDIRVVAATNESLRELVRRGAFREDLFHRLNAFPIYVPPLRERMEEVHWLALYFLEKFRNPRPFLASDADLFLENYHWPGNVRELKHLLEYAALMCEGDTICMNDFPEEVVRGVLV